MCELLVIVADRSNPDPYVDAQCYKRGDVVTVCPDGHTWGDAELKHPQFRIIKLPGILVSDALILAQVETNEDSNQPSYVLQRRAHRLDMDSFPADTREALAANRANPLTKVLWSGPQLVSCSVKKPKLSDPNIFA